MIHPVKEETENRSLCGEGNIRDNFTNRPVITLPIFIEM
jgi:hypothetical protein